MVLTLLRPKYWPGHLAMILCVVAATALGLWQLDAWHARRADAARNISTIKPVPLASVMTGDSSFPGLSLGRPVTFSGTWMPAATVYISDRYVADRNGYWVVTPVLVTGSSSAMPVVRGWSPKAQSAAPSGKVTVTGWLQATEGSGPIDPHPNDNILPAMRLASLVQHVPVDLYSGYVVARDVTGAGGATSSHVSARPVADELVSVSADAVPPVSGFTALRNFLYAIEWWVFAGFALFVWVRWCRDCLNPPDPEAAEADVLEEGAEG